MEALRPAPRLPPLAVLAGVRTPFAKAFGALRNVPADQLGRIAVEAALHRAGLQPGEVDELVFGNVAGQPDASNIGRVVALRAGIPQDRIAHTVNRNCASGMEAIFSAWQILTEGRAQRIVAGGTESMSNVPLLWNRMARDFFLEWSRAGWWRKIGLLARVRPKMFKPVPALELGLTDPICGLNMGQTAEVLAKEFGITRAEQDQFALRSHERATAAWKRGFFTDEVVPVPTQVTGGAAVSMDVGPRANQSLEALAKLKPIFDRENGTVTAGNSCQITDGAAATVLTRADNSRVANRSAMFVPTHWPAAIRGAWVSDPCSPSTNSFSKPACGWRTLNSSRSMRHSLLRSWPVVRQWLRATLPIANSIAIKPSANSIWIDSM